MGKSPGFGKSRARYYLGVKIPRMQKPDHRHDLEVLSDEIEVIETGAAYEAAERFAETGNVADARIVVQFFATRVPGPLGSALNMIQSYYLHEKESTNGKKK